MRTRMAKRARTILELFFSVLALRKSCSGSLGG
jgi:hypothetical protein